MTDPMAARPMTSARLAAIAGRLAAATPGPWRWGYADGSGPHQLVTVMEYPRTFAYGGVVKRITMPNVVTETVTGEGDNEDADRAFIAHAPDDLTYLLAVAEAAATLAARDPVYPTEMDAQCPYCVGHFAAVGGFIHDDDCLWLALTAALGAGEPGA